MNCTPMEAKSDAVNHVACPGGVVTSFPTMAFGTPS